MEASSLPTSDSTSQPPPTHSSIPNSCPNSVSSSITIQNIGSLVPIKLTTTNWLTWSALFVPIFRRYNLTGFVDGSMVAPPKYLLDSSGLPTSTLNPQYVAWFENDREKGRTAGFEEAVRKAMLNTNLGGPHKRIPPESFYTNSWPDCFCQTSPKNPADKCPPDNVLEILDSQLSEVTDGLESNLTMSVAEG